MPRINKMKIALPMVVYCLLFLGLFSLGVFAVIGLVLAYIFIDDTSKKERTHFSYQIRSFWLFILYAILITFITSALAIWLYDVAIPFLAPQNASFHFLLEGSKGEGGRDGVFSLVEIGDQGLQFIVNISNNSQPYIRLDHDELQFLYEGGDGIPRIKFDGNLVSTVARAGLAMLLYLLLWLWAFIRFVKGVSLLIKRRPISNPRTWWI